MCWTNIKFAQPSFGLVIWLLDVRQRRKTSDLLAIHLCRRLRLRRGCVTSLGLGGQKKKIAYGVGGWWLAAVAAAGVLASVQSFLRSNVIGRTSRMWARVSRFQPLQAFQLPAWPRSSSSSRFFRTHKGLQRRRFGWIVREQWGQRAVFVSALRRRWRNYDAIRLFPTRDAKLFLQKLNDQRASCHFVLLLIPFSPIRKTRANWTGRQSEMGGNISSVGGSLSLSLSLIVIVSSWCTAIF